MSDTPTDSEPADGTAADPPTADEIANVLVSAERFLNVQDYQNAYDLLQPLHEGGLVEADELGRTSFLLGEACLGLDGLDAAMYYYEEATAQAPPDLQRKAADRIQELRRRDDAVDAADEGVAGEDEAEAVLRAAEDALANRDFDTARQYFSQAYDGIRMTRSQISRSAVGMADCHMYAHETGEAEGYLQVAEGADASALTARIADIRRRIGEIDAGGHAAEGGVERDELDELWQAGFAASQSRDWESAYGFMMQAYESGAVQGTERGRLAKDLGICCVFTHDYDAAHLFLTEATNIGSQAVVEHSTKLLTRLDAMDAAIDIVDEIDPDHELAIE